MRGRTRALHEGKISMNSVLLRPDALIGRVQISILCLGKISAKRGSASVGELRSGLGAKMRLVMRYSMPIYANAHGDGMTPCSHESLLSNSQEASLAFIERGYDVGLDCVAFHHIKSPLNRSFNTEE